MSNGGFDDAGFDGFPEIDETEALQDSFDSELGEIEQDLEGIIQRLEQPVRNGIMQSRLDRAPIENRINFAVADELDAAREDQQQIFRQLGEPLDRELDLARADVDTLTERMVETARCQQVVTLRGSGDITVNDVPLTVNISSLGEVDDGDDSTLRLRWEVEFRGVSPQLTIATIETETVTPAGVPPRKWTVQLPQAVCDFIDEQLGDGDDDTGEQLGFPLIGRTSPFVVQGVRCHVGLWAAFFGPGNYGPLGTLGTPVNSEGVGRSNVVESSRFGLMEFDIVAQGDRPAAPTPNGRQVLGWVFVGGILSPEQIQSDYPLCDEIVDEREQEREIVTDDRRDEERRIEDDREIFRERERDDCPPPPPIKGVAVNCESRLLVVTDVAAIERDDNLILVQQLNGRGEFDLDDLLAVCDEPDRQLERGGELFSGVVDPQPGQCPPFTHFILPPQTRQEFNNLLSVGAGVSGGASLIGVINSLGQNLTDSAPWVFMLLQMMRTSINSAKGSWKQLRGFDDQLWGSVYQRGLMNTLNRFTPGLWDELIERNNQLIRLRTPWRYPTASQAHTAYLAGRISFEDWQCYQAAEGFEPEFQKAILEGNRTRLDNLDLLQLLLKAQIPPDEFRRRMRENGWIDEREVELFIDSREQLQDLPSLIGLRRRGIIDRTEFLSRAHMLGWFQPDKTEEQFKLSEQIPFQSDLIRFMVRDAADPRIVQKFGLDDQFNQKFQGKVKEWAEWQGVPEEAMKFNWRAHWRIPSANQLFEIFHRVGRQPDGTPIQSVVDDIRDALIQDDVLPFWIDRLLATSFRMPRLAQARRAYFGGGIDRNRFREILVRRGLETDVAEAMTKFEEIQKQQRFVKDPFVRKFAQGEVTQTELETVLQQQGADQNEINLAVQRGDLLGDADRRKKCLASIRKRYLTGELTNQQMGNAVIAELGPTNQAANIVNKFECEKQARSKAPTAAMLCRWFNDGLVDSAEFQSRLFNLGYTPEDASRIVSRCQIQLQRKIEKQERQAQEKQLREQRRQERKRQREIREREAELERTRKAREAARKAKEQRDKQILMAARRLANRGELDVSETAAGITRLVNRAVRNRIASAREAVDAAGQISQVSDVDSLPDFEREFFDVLTTPQPQS